MQHKEYRAAVSLNNYGATLLERGQCCQAASVLKDSLTIMHSVLESESNSSKCVVSQAHIAEKLHFATKSMINSHPAMRTKSYLNQFNTFRYDGVGSIPLEDCSLCISIDNFDTIADSDCLRDDMNLHSAIIVYNSVVSRISYAGASGSRRKLGTLRSCVKILKGAHGILARVMQRRPREATLLNVLLLGKLASLLEDTGETSEALRVSKAHQSLKEALNAFESIVPSGTLAGSA